MGIARRILGGPAFRAPVRLAMAAAGAWGRLWSFLRARALFPDDPDVVCHWSTEVKYPSNITLGRRVVIGAGCTIGAKAPIYLGDDVLSSKEVIVETGTADVSTPPPYRRMAKPIRIERGVWLGARAMVLGGVTIGENSIIAAGAIVRKSVPANSFVSTERVRVQPFLPAEAEPAGAAERADAA
jgi:acetyltransferase-like isoleucine patch superfamily enzyme